MSVYRGKPCACAGRWGHSWRGGQPAVDRQRWCPRHRHRRRLQLPARHAALVPDEGEEGRTARSAEAEGRRPDRAAAHHALRPVDHRPRCVRRRARREWAGPAAWGMDESRVEGWSYAKVVPRRRRLRKSDECGVLERGPRVAVPVPLLQHLHRLRPVGSPSHAVAVRFAIFPARV